MKILTDDVVSRYVSAKPCVRNSRALVNVIASELGLSVPKTRSLLMQAGVYVTDDRKTGAGGNPDLSGLTKEENLALLDKALRRTRAHTAEDRVIMAKRYGFDESFVFTRMKEVRAIDDAASARKVALMVGSVILAGIVLLVFAVNQTQGVQDNPRYRDLTPEGKEYVDDQMRQYDAYCGQSPKPAEC